MYFFEDTERLCVPLDLIERDYYTDREKVHHKQYEDKV